MAETTTKAPPKKIATKTATASAKPIAKKTTAKTPVATPTPAAKKSVSPTKPAAVKKPAAKVVKKAGKTMVVSDEQRYRMIAEAAYYRAESNQFKSDPVRDWIEAESDIAALLSGTK